ncbi:MAG: response regulator transcription factor [Proteobacteria bacterium]|nr:response regulator transcription factor [Pseudomonadota bacterium]
MLLIEDHKDIAEMVYEYLEVSGFSVDYADTGSAGVNLARQNNYDAIVLDLMLPDMDGIEVCKALRSEEGITVPVLMLTARDTLEDKLLGFDSGADDYLVKPFDLEELAARLRSLMKRRTDQSKAEPLVVGDLVVDVNAKIATREGNVLNLSPTGMKILILLTMESPNVVERSAVEKVIWDDLPPDSDALRSHLYNLRKVVDKPYSHSLIHTVHSIGFRLSDEGAD